MNVVIQKNDETNDYLQNKKKLNLIYINNFYTNIYHIYVDIN